MEVVASLSQGRTAAAQYGLFKHKSVPVIFEPPCKMDKRANDKLVRSPGENGGGQDAQKDLHPRTRRDDTKGKTQGRMERGSRKRSSSAGSEKMERVGDR